MNQHTAVVVAVLPTVLVTATLSWAASPDPSDEEKTFVRQGTDCFLRQDYECARIAIHKAYDLSPRPETVLKLGLSELQSSRPVEAVAHLREYLTHVEEPEAKRKAVRAKWLPRAEAATARLEVFAPAGARVVVDDGSPDALATSVSEPPKSAAGAVSVVVAAGSHDVMAQAGPTIETRHIVARGGELVDIHFQRVADAEPAPLTGAAYTDGVRPAEDGRVRLTLRPKWVAVLGFGAAAVGTATVGAFFAFASAQSSSQAVLAQGQVNATGGCPGASPWWQCANLNAARHNERVETTVADGLWIGAGVAALAAVGSWLYWPEPKRGSPPFEATPIVDAGRVGVAMSGAW